MATETWDVREDSEPTDPEREAFDQAVYAIRQRVLDAKRAKAVEEFNRRGNVPPANIWAGSLGHPCGENGPYLYHHLTTVRPAIDGELQSLFDLGKGIESLAIQNLREAGFIVIDISQESGRQFKYQIAVRGGVISGQLDCWIAGHELGEEPIPCEIKGYANVGGEHLTLDAFLNARQPWLVQVPAQVHMYLYQANAERGALACYDKRAGTFWPAPVHLDSHIYDIYEARAVHAFAAVAAGECPRAIYRRHWCERCDFHHAPCEPTFVGSGTEVREDPDLIALLDRRGELAAAVKEYERLDGEAKARFEGVPAAVCGGWIIEGGEQVRKYQAKPARESRFWQTKIMPLKPGEEDESDGGAE